MAKKTRNYLALDLGAESGRGMIGRFDGKRITLEEVHRFTHTRLTYNNSLRWDVLRMAHELKLALAAAAEKTRGDLTSLAVDTWGVDYVLLDRNDDVLRYPYHYRDARTTRSQEAVFERMSRQEIFKVTGLQFMPFNTLYQLYADVMAGSGVLDMARTLLFMPDFLTYALGGDKACEYSIASTSQMLDAKKRAWAKAMLNRLDIPTHFLQPLVQPGSVTGKLHKEIVHETGAPARMKVVAAGRHDTASAVAAVPARGEDWAYLSSGTWSLLGAEVDEPVIDQPDPDRLFTNEGGLENTIRLLINISGLWLQQELRRDWTDKQGNAPDYPTLENEAAEAAPFGPIVDPDWPPFALPGRMVEKFTKFCTATRQNPPRTRGEFVRCAFDSLALAYRESISRLETLLGRPVGVLHIVGGGSMNLLLNQLTADACGVRVLAGPKEATALGNVLAQMLADRQIKSLDEGREIVRASCRPKTYKPRDTAQWDEAYERFLKLRGRKVAFK